MVRVDSKRDTEARKNGPFHLEIAEDFRFGFGTADYLERCFNQREANDRVDVKAF